MNPGSLRPAPESIACPDCGLAQQLPAVAPGCIAECRRCGKLFAQPVPGGRIRSLALIVAALFAWVPGSIGTLMAVSFSGTSRASSLSSGVTALWSTDFRLLALIVATFSILVPSLYLALLAIVLADGPTTGALARGRLFRWVVHLRPWTMLEVYLLGCCVAYSRIRLVANVTVGICGWCLVGATFLTLLAVAELDERSIWQRVPVRRARPELGPEVPAHVRMFGCLSCDFLATVAGERGRCPRCGGALRARKPAAMQRTLALVICGFLLYIPANLLPVLTIERYGQMQTNTILGGVAELMRTGLWPLAAIVFVASVVIPLAKLCGLSWMMWLTRRGSLRWLRGRTQLYRLIDVIGRWSNIDVFMISLLVALVQFGALTRVQAQPGALAFAAVVVVTMVAVKTFDARLMWDAAGERG
jgi:paraquat-inducible protein A